MNSLFESSYLNIMSELNDKLREENKQLQERIEKAIEFIELDMYGTALEILKGEE